MANMKHPNSCLDIILCNEGLSIYFKCPLISLQPKLLKCCTENVKPVHFCFLVLINWPLHPTIIEMHFLYSQRPSESLQWLQDSSQWAAFCFVTAGVQLLQEQSWWATFCPDMYFSHFSYKIQLTTLAWASAYTVVKVSNVLLFMERFKV